MKFKKYVKESTTLTNDTTLVLNEDFGNDTPSLISDEIDMFYAPVEKLIEGGRFDEARVELDALEQDLLAFEEENNKKKFFKFPKFMIDGQKNRIAAIRAKLPKNESLDDMDKRCEKCNTLLNDGGTCPKCDDGEEGVIEEALSNKEKLKRAYPELNFDTPVTEECEIKEELSVREKLKAAYPELNFDKESTEPVIEAVTTEELSNREKLKRAYPELNFDESTVQESIETPDEYSDYDDNYDIEDDVEMDHRHAALYGGDRMYCDCGHKLSYDEGSSYCPICEPHHPEYVYEESVENTICDNDSYDDEM